MMKKLSKIALLAAATAFLLAAFPACEHEDKNPEPSVKIEGEKSVKVDATITLTASSSGFTPTSYKWSSDNTDVAAVEEASTDPSKATVTGVAEGNAKITVKATDGTTTKTAEVTVTVSDEASVGSKDALTGTWTALDYATSKNYVDKTAISSGTALGNVFVEGTNVVWRTDSGNTKWTHLELGKAKNGCLKFTIDAASTIVVEAASTGGSNTSDIVLTTDDDTSGVVNGDKNTVSGSDYVSVTYATVSAGTYYLGAFPATTNGRGVRIKSITVTAL